MDLYCSDCGGTVNAGGVCPFKEQPANCPLDKTEKENQDGLKRQAAAAKERAAQ